MKFKGDDFTEFRDSCRNFCGADIADAANLRLKEMLKDAPIVQRASVNFAGGTHGDVWQECDVHCWEDLSEPKARLISTEEL